MAGAKEGSVATGESLALHRDRTAMGWQTSIRDADGRLCALVTQTRLWMVVGGARTAAGRTMGLPARPSWRAPPTAQAAAHAHFFSPTAPPARLSRPRRT